MKRLLDLPPNDFFYAHFRAYYLIIHMTDVMPRKPDLAQIRESALSIFAVYRGVDPNWHSPPRPEWMPTVENTPAKETSGMFCGALACTATARHKTL